MVGGAVRANVEILEVVTEVFAFCILNWGDERDGYIWFKVMRCHDHRACHSGDGDPIVKASG